MDNNNEEKKDDKIAYSIPGVIIPEQKTDNGILMASDESEVLNETDNSSDTTTPPPEDGSVGEVDSKKEEVLSETNTPVPEVPDVPITPPVETPVKNETNPPKKKKDNTPVYVLIILILLGLSGYLIYNDYQEKKNKVDPAVAYKRKRTLNTTSLVVQELFSYVNLTGCKEQVSFFYNSNPTVNLADLKDEDKNYLAYLQLKHNKFQTKNCSTIPVALKKSDPIGLWTCGDDTNKNDDTNRETVVFGEKDLKEQVEKMFGVGTYKGHSFESGQTERFLYDSKSESYIYQSFYANSGSCNTYQNSLADVTQKGDVITLTVKVENNKNKKLIVYKYNFIESEDGNYYFSSLNKEGV